MRVQPLEPNTTWKKATVMTPVGHRSYNVELDSDGILRCNRRHLRKAVDTETATTTSDTPLTTDENQMPSLETENEHRVTTTRSGRVVQKPKYLTDYVYT